MNTERATGSPSAAGERETPDSTGSVTPDSNGALTPDSAGPVTPDSNGAVTPDSDAGALDRLMTSAPGPGEAALDAEELEALLFVAERPLSRREIAGLAGVDVDAVNARLGDLEVALRERGIRLISSGDQVELATAPERSRLIARYVGAQGLKLSPAALETLAIVAYRQPATRGLIERIRGVDSDYVLRGLLHRRLIVEQGRADSPGRPFLYGTAFEFLERFGLTSLDDLPPLEAELAATLAAPDPVEALPAEPAPADQAPPAEPASAEPAPDDSATVEAGDERTADAPVDARASRG
jgi:segregation and condensation protein B